MLATGKQVPQVAEEYDYSKRTFYRAINNDWGGLRRSQQSRIQDLISTIIGRSKNEIWPENQPKEKAA